MAMMASGTSGNIYDDDDDHNVLDDDFLDDGAQANVLDPSSSINTFADIEPDEPAATSDRAPLTGNIQSSSSHTLSSMVFCGALRSSPGIWDVR